MTPPLSSVPKARKRTSRVPQLRFLFRFVALFLVPVHLLTLQPVLMAVEAAQARPVLLPALPVVVFPAEERPMDKPAQAVNRTLPSLDVPLSGDVAVGAESVLGAGVFEEPLVAVGAVATPRDLEAARKLISQWKSRRSLEDFSVLESFVREHPRSPWNVALLLNWGIEARRTGYYSQALVAWQKAWDAGKEETRPLGRMIVDRVAGELAQLNARLGRYDWLESFFVEIQDRSIQGSATEKIAGARQGLWLMRNEPEKAFRCGPMALDRIRAAADSQSAFDPKIIESKSTLRGMSLNSVRDLATELKMDYVMVRRDPGADLSTLSSAVIHWKIGHYAALIETRDGRYRLEDPTFGDVIWVSQKAIDAEASGNFLIPRPESGTLPVGWHLLTDAQGEEVWGKGNSAQSDPRATKCVDVKVKSGTDCVSCEGMAQYDVHAMLVSLTVGDTPLRYSPPKGESVELTVRYNQREYDLPAVYTYSNFGSKWVFGWINYITDTSLSADVPPVLHLGSGGSEVYPELEFDLIDGIQYPRVTYYYDTSTNPPTRYVETAEYKPDRTTKAVLKKTSRNVYQKTYLDGSKEIYAHMGTDPAVVAPRSLMLTQKVDAQGNTTTLTYDSLHRLRAVTDALGQVTTVFYDYSPDPLKISKVEDPFGRFATFAYNAAHQLVKITDVVGLTSEFTYIGDFLNTLKTGYGTTTFDFGEAGTTRWLNATDPLGDKERTEYTHSGNVPAVEPAVPVGMPLLNLYLPYRNTFYWSKKAYKEAWNGTVLDYKKAALYHWLHTEDPNVCAGVLENTKQPFESRVWISYQGQTDPSSVNKEMLAQPAFVGRVLDDGSTQLNQYTYNAAGLPTNAIDPLGRETRMTYGGVGEIDLLEVRQVNGAGTDLLTTVTYNSTHQPLTVQDVSGQITTFTYNGAGQLLTVKDPLNRITTMAYTGGYLMSITGPQPGSTVTFEYDGFGRVWKVTNSDSYTIATEYDALNRPTRVTYPDGSYEQVTYNLLNAEWSRDRMGRWSRSYFNAIKQVIGVLDPAYQFTEFQWCKCGALWKIIDPLGRITSWKHDAQGRLTGKVFPDKNTETYTYEPLSGRLSSVTDALGQTQTFQYFKDNSTKQVAYTSAQRPAFTVNYTYQTAYQRLATMVDSQGTTTYTYVLPGTFGAGAANTVDGPLPNDTITFAYDSLGRVTSDTIGTTSSSVHYDDLGRVDSSTNALGTFSYGYDGVSARLLNATYPNAQQTNLTYSDNVTDNRLTGISHTKSGGALLSSYNYTHDVLGRIQTWTQKRGSLPSTAYALAYDQSNQLSQATLRDVASQALLKEFSYRFDAAGNRVGTQSDASVSIEAPNLLNQLTSSSVGGILRVSGALTEAAAVTVNGAPAQVDGANRFDGSIQAVPGVNQFQVQATDGSGNIKSQNYQVTLPGGQGKTLQYDTNGNLVQMTAGAQSSTYEWDAADHLLAINAGIHRTEFSYDGAGRRVRIVEKDNGVVSSDKRLLWVGLTLREERNSTGGVVNKRYFAQGVQVAGTGNLFYTRDHLGSVREVVDSTGTIRARYDYEPYGKRTRTEGNLDVDAGFTGHYVHQATGFYLTPTRLYDSDSGRWLSRDPIAESGGLNLYAYCGNDPINAVDPLGLSWQGIAVGITVGLVVGIALGAALGTGLAAAIVIGVVAGVIGNLAEQLYDNGGELSCVNWQEAGFAGLLGGIFGGVGYGLGRVLSRALAARMPLARLQGSFDDLAEQHLLPYFRSLDPSLKAGYTGSFKTGIVGNPTKPTFGQPIDLKKFDIDYWIESDVLFQRFGPNLKANPAFRKILSDTPGFQGLKANKEGFSIKFKPSGG